MKKLLPFLILNLYGLISFSQVLDPYKLENDEITCEDGNPYIFKLSNYIWYHNVNFSPTCSTNFSHITSSVYIRLSGTTQIGTSPAMHIPLGAKVHFKVLTPKESYVKASINENINYVTVLYNINFIFTEEYLNNSILKYKIYQFKEDNNSYSANNEQIEVNRGDNFLTIPVGSLNTGLYTLEIIDQKGVSYYVKFKKL